MAVAPNWFDRWNDRQGEPFKINPHNDLRGPRDNRPGLTDVVRQISTVGDNLAVLYPGGTGLQVPQVTTAERDAIPAPVPGTLVWNTDSNELDNWTGTAWMPTAGGGGGAVLSVFGRVGNVLAANGDYAGSQVTNDSGVAGADVSAALDTLDAASGVNSVFGRTGAVVAASGDYAGSEVTNDSSVAGATVSAALDTLAGAAAPVTSVFGRTGAVVAASGDYTSTEVTNASSVVGTNVTAALNTLLAAVVPKPAYVDTFDIGGLATLSGSGRTNATSGRAIYYPIIIPRALTVSALQTRVINVTGGSTWTIQLGIYNYDDATRTPSTRVFFGQQTGIIAAGDVNITTFTGSPALAAGRYFFAALAVLTAGSGQLRRLIPNDLDDSAVGNAVGQLRIEDGLTALQPSATSAAFTPGSQAFWSRAVVSLP